MVNNKEKVIKSLKYLLDNLSNSSNQDKLLRLSRLTIDKVATEENISFSSDEIEEYLFNNCKDGTREIDILVWQFFKGINVDMKDVNFDNVNISGFHLSDFENVHIDLDKVPNKDLSKCTFRGVMLSGNLDNAIVNSTNFSGYETDNEKGYLTLDVDKVSSLNGVKLNGIKVCGSFNDKDISGVDFSGALGDIKIDPQKVKDKHFICTKLDGVTLVGEDGVPSFKDVILIETSFRGVKNKELVINLDELPEHTGKICCCDLTGVTVVGNAVSNHEEKDSMREDGTVLFDASDDDLYGSYYYDKDGRQVYIYLHRSAVWNEKKKCWEFIDRESEENLNFTTEFKRKEEKSILKRIFRKKND